MGDRRRPRRVHERHRAPWEFGSDDWRPHILTSMVKRLDVGVYGSIADYVAGNLTGGERVYGLADGGVEYATSGGFIDDIVPELERLKQQIIDGDIVVRAVPGSSDARP